MLVIRCFLVSDLCGKKQYLLVGYLGWIQGHRVKPPSQIRRRPEIQSEGSRWESFLNWRVDQDPVEIRLVESMA